MQAIKLADRAGADKVISAEDENNIREETEELKKKNTDPKP